jgi:hypothetical protein
MTKKCRLATVIALPADPVIGREFRIVTMTDSFFSSALRFLKLGVLALLLCCGSVSCSGFRAAWRDAAGHPIDRKDALAGRWEGSWRSESTDHHGRLRCVVASASGQAPGDSGRYVFHFHATWARVFAGGWKMICNVSRDEQGGWCFEGARELGWGLGSYRFKGTVDEQGMFAARYEGAQDRGFLQMRRLSPPDP